MQCDNSVHKNILQTVVNRILTIFLFNISIKKLSIKSFEILVIIIDVNVSYLCKL